MRNLRVIRVDAANATLYLSDADGHEYSLPIDDELLDVVIDLTSPTSTNASKPGTTSKPAKTGKHSAESNSTETPTTGPNVTVTEAGIAFGRDRLPATDKQRTGTQNNAGSRRSSRTSDASSAATASGSAASASGASGGTASTSGTAGPGSAGSGSAGSAAAARRAPEARPLRPREIQARIREGATAQQLVEETGTDIKLIESYEGPILAERRYRAQQAQAIEVSAPQNNEGYRAAFGDNPANLGDMVRARLRANGIDVETLRWDSWKVNAGAWTVIADFVLPETAPNVGGEPPAEWIFHPTRRHLENRNRWAQVLSEWEPWDFSAPPRRLVPVADEPDQPFNVEDGPLREVPRPVTATGSSAGSEDAGASAPDTAPGKDDSDQELLDVLTRRRGTRVGEDAEGDDALAHLIAQSHQDREHSGADGEAPDRTDGQHLPDIKNVSFPPLRRVPDPAAGRSRAKNEDSGRKSGNNLEPHPLWGDPRNSGHGRASEAEGETDAETTHRKRRSKMPSWDEIVFGRGARHPDEE